jgi:hypothetical protein
MISRSSLFSILTLALPFTASASLVAWYPLDTDASDASGNGHNGAVVGGTVNFGQAGANASTGQSAAFPDNGHIDVPFSSALNGTSFTVALWANAASTGGFASPVTSRDNVGAPTPSTHGYILYNNNTGNWDFWTGDGDPGWDTLTGALVTVSNWTHLAITYDAGTDTKSLWVDGVVSVTSNVPQSGPTQYSPNGTVEMKNLHIGSGQDDGSNFFFSGNIDDVSIWDTALSQSEIQNIMNNGIPEPSAVAPFAITGIDYAPDAEPNPTVTLTWRKSGADSYIAKYSLDMTDWGADIGAGLNAEDHDENPGDPDHITATFDLAAFALDNETDLFFRIEEE